MSLEYLWCQKVRKCFKKGWKHNEGHGSQHENSLRSKLEQFGQTNSDDKECNPKDQIFTIPCSHKLMIINKHERKQIFLPEESQCVNVEVMRKTGKALLEEHGCNTATGKTRRSKTRGQS